MSYENVLIREATERYTPWCSDCERDADECVCEEICDHFRSEDVGVFSNSGGDVCVPAPSEHLHERGLEAEPYTYEEADARRNERIGDSWQNDPYNYAI